jgi:hypothetical protein
MEKEMYIKIYEGCRLVNGVLTPVEKERIVGLTMLQTEQLERVFFRNGIVFEKGDE